MLTPSLTQFGAVLALSCALSAAGGYTWGHLSAKSAREAADNKQLVVDTKAAIQIQGESFNNLIGFSNEFNAKVKSNAASFGNDSIFNSLRIEAETNQCELAPSTGGNNGKAETARRSKSRSALNLDRFAQRVGKLAEELEYERAKVETLQSVVSDYRDKCKLM
jgi:hypothetical protein